ncbi:ATP-binding protein [Tepidibacillus fermentans]|uniref:histidine kinase n=1 Tax=Tepidibacillus fermentans TaxID=1281767 RepID=A0A4R3KKR6_9BACI|nr:ATP-binding protein [Tepidibacillus fermentans]TCS84102.1 two-component system sensor histidine kinase ResE [Tepidibacillus fermentans]
MIFRKVVGKLWLTIVGLVFVILLLLSLFLIQYFDHYYYHEQSKNLSKLAYKVSQTLEAHPERKNAVSTTRELVEAYDIDLIVIDLPSKKEDSDPPIQLRSIIPKEDLNDIYSGKELITRISYKTSQNITSNNEKSDLLVVSVPIKRNNQLVGAVVLSQSLDIVNQTTNDLKKIIFGFAAVGFIMVTVFSFFLSTKITAPIRQMQKAANLVAQGDFNIRVNIRTNDEIGDLGISFNQMASQLEQTVKDLSTEKEKLSNILKSMADGVITMNPDSEIIMANPPAKKLLDIYQYGNQLNDFLKEMLDIVLKQEINLTKDLHYNGRILSVIMTPLYSGHVIIGAVTILRDVTYERKLDKLRKDFLANVSHELRTPISMLQGYSEAIIDGIAETDEEKKELAQIIYDESLRMGRLVNELLDLAKMESGNLQLQYCKTDMDKLIKKIIRKFFNIAKEHEIELVSEVDSRLINVVIDPDRIEQVLTNLIDNALRHTKKNGEIKIKARKKSLGEMLIEVSDTGVGIPEEDLPFVFERFYKADKARTRGSGTGLGLSIVKNIIQAHGGSISVSSKIGQGTTFSIVLPTHNLAD